MKLRYVRGERYYPADYNVYLEAADDRRLIAEVDKGIWEMPRRSRWEIRFMLGKAKTGWHYEDTLAEAKEYIESCLIRFIESGLEEILSCQR